MIKSWIFYFIYITIILILNIFTSSSDAFLLLIVSILIPALAALIHRVLRQEININIKLPDSAEKNNVILGEIEVLNKKRIVCPLIKLDIVGKNLLTNENRNFTVKCSLSPRGKSTMQFKMKDSFCGKIIFTSKQIKTYDIFGLTYKKISEDIKDSIVILPEIHPANISLSGGYGGQPETEEYSGEKPGFDLSEPFEYREYVPGDSPKSIHWKLSQKLDKIIIRQGGMPAPKSVLLILNTCISGKTDFPSFGQLCRTAEIFISASKSLNDANIPHTLCFFDHENKMMFNYSISVQEDWMDIIPKFMSAQFKIDNKSCFERYSEHFSENFGHILCISPCETNFPEIKNAKVTILNTNESVKLNLNI